MEWMLLGIYSLFILCIANEINRDFNKKWLVFFVFLHLVAAVLLPMIYVFPDEIAYHEGALDISEQWDGILPPEHTYSTPGYYNILAFQYHYFTSNQIFARMTNVFLHILTAFVLYAMTLKLYPQSAKITFWVTLLFPSQILWTSTILRESLTLFLVACGLYCGILALQKKQSRAGMFLEHKGRTYRFGIDEPFWVITIFMFYYMLLGVRWYVGLVLLMAWIATYTYNKISDKRYLLAAVAGIIILLYLFTPLQNVGLKRIERSRELMTKGTYIFGEGDDISTISGLLMHLPRGIAYALFSPFPWNPFTLLSIIYFLNHILWYPIVIGFLLFLPRITKIEEGFILLYALGMLAFLSIVEGNVGNLVRHREMFALAIIPFGVEYLRTIYSESTHSLITHLREQKQTKN